MTNPDAPQFENLSAAEWRDRVRAGHWGLLCRLRGLTQGRPGRCREHRTAPTVQVVLPAHGHVTLRGVESCGSVWGCPVCCASVCAERANQVRDLVSDWGASRTVLVTCTVRHSRADLLSREVTGVARAWQALWRGRAVAVTRERWGIGPWVRAVEVTHGCHGWHAHVHSILCLREMPSDVSQLREEWTRRWQRAVVSTLGAKAMPDELHAVDVSVVRDSSYLVKLGLEVSGARKRARGEGSAHPWDLAELAAAGEPRGVILWREYVAGTKGHRQLTWSAEARRMRRTDAQIATEPSDGELVCEFTANQWADVIARPLGLAEVMQIAADSVDV